MATRLRVAVLTHEMDDFHGEGYLLGRVCAAWRKAGHDVVVAQGMKDPPAADVAVLHTDLTIVPPEYLEFAQRYPVVINGSTRDISKRVVSQQIVTQSDSYSGPVIVKTNANFGGKPEARKSVLRGEAPPTLEQVNWGNFRALAKYPILRSKHAVPDLVWTNPNLIVDKFTPERTPVGEFVLRIWIFLGDRSLHYRAISLEPNIKSSNTIRREQLDRNEIPEELRQRRAELGFDYGKFDYVQINGRAVLLDANKTPGLPGQDDSEQNAEKFQHLSEGVYHFLTDKADAASEKVS
jgi:hypothetical protein